jgi:L-seryl-tRNA(Ser) seleniumtransferase
MEKPLSREKLLRELPSVDAVLKGPQAAQWLKAHPRRFVLRAVREAVEAKRRLILDGVGPLAGPSGTGPSGIGPSGIGSLAGPSGDSLSGIGPSGIGPSDGGPTVEDLARPILLRLSCMSLQEVINATGIVLHTNLGRAPIARRAVENLAAVACGYSNLEYDLDAGLRGKRHVHLTEILRELTGAEDAVVLNNNAACVFLCLKAMAEGREVIVSRGELVEIGGSFRIPDIMAQSGAILKEVGTTNKTRLSDYEAAVGENTALILKVHKSNFRIAGFSEETSIEELVEFSRPLKIPVMFDLGSGCLIDLKPLLIQGAFTEPTVQDVVAGGADIVTFSGDKLLGGPQAGIIVGKREYVERVRRHPLARVMRVDKFTISALEATLMEYADPQRAVETIPVLKMLFQDLQDIEERAGRIAAGLEKRVPDMDIAVAEDKTYAGGGSLPDVEFATRVVTLMPRSISVNDLEKRLRRTAPPVIARIKDNRLVLDARSIMDEQVDALIEAVTSASGM